MVGVDVSSADVAGVEGGRLVVAVAVTSLVPGPLIRSQGQDSEHVARLAEVEGPLPPIIVNRRDMRVIDGMHRLLAAVSRGQESIEVEYFDGSDDEAFLLEVHANTAHGLPLSDSA